MGMPWQPMHIEIFPLAASALPCARAGRERQDSSKTSVVLILVIVILRKPGDSMSKPLREATLEPSGDGVCDALLHLLRAHPQLLVAVQDHARLEEHGGRSRGLEDDEIVVVVHAVLLVRERLVLSRYRIGVIERRSEPCAAQRLPDRRCARETFLHRGVLARDEQREARFVVVEAALHVLVFPGLDEVRLD